MMENQASNIPFRVEGKLKSINLFYQRELKKWFESIYSDWKIYIIVWYFSDNEIATYRATLKQSYPTTYSGIDRMSNLPDVYHASTGLR